MLTAIFLLLPALAYGKIVVLVDFTADSPYVDVNGDSSNVITDQQRQLFKITDQQLKKAVANYSKDTPRDVFVKEETRFNLHKTYKWSVIRRTVEARAKNFNITCETKPWITKKGFVNEISQFDDNTTFISENITFKILHDYDTANFDSEWGSTAMHERRFSVSFQPANLTKCEVTFDLEYVAILTGDVVVNFNHKWKGHYFWAFDIKKIQRSNGLPTTEVRHEKVKIRYGEPKPQTVATIPT